MIGPTDIVFHYSTPTGPGMAATSTPARSLGGWCALSRVAADPANNLFADLTGADNEAGTQEVRCIFVRNTHMRSTLLDTQLWAEQTPGGTIVEFAVDPVAALPEDTVERQTSLVVPHAWSAASSPDEALRVGHLPPRHVRAIWVRRTAVGSGPKTNDGFVLRIAGDTIE